MRINEVEISPPEVQEESKQQVPGNLLQLLRFIMRFMGISKLDKLLSLIVLVTCCIALFYSITGYLSNNPDPTPLISQDLLTLEESQIASLRHQKDSKQSLAIKTEQEDSSYERTPMTPPPTHESTPSESPPQTHGFKIVGDGLQVPKGKDKNFLFLKTHKCGTSTLVNMLYLFGIRRRLNFVTNPWSRQLDIEQ